MMTDEEKIEALKNVDKIAQICITTCEEKKAGEIVLFDVKEKNSLVDYHLLCCGNSKPHIQALADTLRRTLEAEGYSLRGKDGSSASQWIVLDFGVILIHIMEPSARRFYRLEDLWDSRLMVYTGGTELPEIFDEEGNDEDDWEDDEEENDWEDEDDEDDEEDWGDWNDEDEWDEEEDWDNEEDEEWFDEDEDEEDEPEKNAKPSKGDINLRDLFGDKN